MNSPKESAFVSRRTALAGLGAGGLAVATTTHASVASAHDKADMANHPLVGTWLAGTGPNDIGLARWDADGGLIVPGGVVGTGPDGAQVFNDPPMGVWEPEGERGAHITFEWVTRDATGAAISFTSVDAHPAASADGESFADDGTRVVVTVRDSTGAVTQEMTGVPPVTGVRIHPGKPGYEELFALLAAQPAASPAAGTPTS
jgi:hypothetical protein